MSIRTYTKKSGSVTFGVTVESVPGRVIEHPFNSMSGGGYGRKHRTRFPALKARRIGRDLRRAGYREARRG